MDCENDMLLGVHIYIRICRATSNYSFFLDSAKKLISRMSKHGADDVGIKKVITKMMCRH